MEPENQAALLPFLQRVRAELPEKDVWLYTGYRLESVSDSPLLLMVDVVVDGPFIEEEKDVSLAFRGSRNQRIIHLAGPDTKGGEATDRDQILQEIHG